MSRKKFWAYLRNEQGQPIPSASISFKLNDTGQLAQLYTTPVSAVSDEVDQTTLTTDVSGFFQFFVGDVYETGKKIGYDPDQLFKLEWTSVDGTKSGVIDDMQIFYQIFPVDATDQYSVLKNKLASNKQTYNWEVHRQQTWFHEIHGITQLDWSGDDKNDGTYSKVVSNSQMNYLQGRLDSVKASGADSVTIESSAAIARGFDIPSGSWSPSGDLYYYDVTHNFDSRYPLVQLWCTILDCVQYPAKLDFIDSNMLRVYVPPNERDGKHLVTISDISPVYVYQEPLVSLDLQTLTMTPLTATISAVTSVTASAGLLSMTLTSLSTGVSATSAAPASGAFIDDFFTGSLGSQWTESYQSGGSSTNTGTTQQITSGNLSIDTTSFNGNGIYQTPISGDFDVKCMISSHGTIADKVSFGFWSSPTDYIIIYKDSTNNIRYLYKFYSGNGSGGAGVVSAPNYLRIKRTGSDIVLYQSSDGSTWTLKQTVVGVFPDDGSIWISVNDNGGSSFTADVSAALNFNTDF